MVAGKNAETAGIHREAFVETKLGAEISDQVTRVQIQLHIAPQRFAHVGIKRRQHTVIAAQEDMVFRRFG